MCPREKVNCSRVADATAPEEFMPIKVATSDYRCFLYEWNHPRGVVNVCCLISPSVDAAVGRIVELPVKQSFAPHVPGIPVDSGEIVVELAKDSHAMEAGLGDGYYPVYGCKRVFRRPTAILIDFKIWKTDDKMILMGNQRLDEYGIVCMDDE